MHVYASTPRDISIHSWTYSTRYVNTGHDTHKRDNTRSITRDHTPPDADTGHRTADTGHMNDERCEASTSRRLET